MTRMTSIDRFPPHAEHAHRFGSRQVNYIPTSDGNFPTRCACSVQVHELVHDMRTTRQLQMQFLLRGAGLFTDVHRWPPMFTEVHRWAPMSTDVHIQNTDVHCQTPMSTSKTPMSSLNYKDLFPGHQLSLSTIVCPPFSVQKSIFQT